MIDLTWYNSLIRPPFTPPAWIFAPVWTFLYITIFLALIFYVLKFTIKDKKFGYIFYFTQFFLNLIWTPVFFNLHNIGFALVILILIDISTLATMFEFFKISKKSAYLLIPYAIWIIYATYLNTGVLFLNS